jgi:hypothetical protein
MPFFNHPAHAALTLPLLSEALVATAHFDARKIFFADRWIGSFVGGQRDARAARAIRELLRDHRIDAALSPKVREALYLLDRCIASRTRWARP